MEMEKRKKRKKINLRSSLYDANKLNFLKFPIVKLCLFRKKYLGLTFPTKSCALAAAGGSPSLFHGVGGCLRGSVIVVEKPPLCASSALAESGPSAR